MSTRTEQRDTSVGGQKNLGSNRNAEGTREVSNRDRVKHQVVEAHGVTDIGYTPDQHTRKHEAGTFEGKGESAKRQVGPSAATLGRHVKSVKSGAEVAKQREDVVKSTRAKREVENFGK
jgi:hypothetical protein